MSIKRFITGPLKTNSYVVSQHNNQCLIFDPSMGCEELLYYLKEAKLNVEAICLTHGHFDHILGIEEILACHKNCSVWIHQNDETLLRNCYENGSYEFGIPYTYSGIVHYLHEGLFQIGHFSCRVFHIPGHSPGGCAFFWGTHCITGDTLLANTIGWTDLNEGNRSEFLQHIKNKIVSLPDNTILLSGHGGRTTVNREKRLNPFL